MAMMYEMHNGSWSLDDGGNAVGGGALDFWGNPETKEDTFDVCGYGTMSSAQFGNFLAGFAAGHARSTVAYEVVRAFGAYYGIAGAAGGHASWGQLKYLGDNEDSVAYINEGWWLGLGIKTR